MMSKKIVIIGGTGLIGAKLARLLALAGHTVVAASPGMGVNSVTGQGLSEVMHGADVLVDVSNIMSFDTAEVRAFFETSGRNLVAAAADAGVAHHVVLSIVGVDRMPDIGYFQGKLLQEEIAAAGGLPYTIVRSTQFFEFLGTLADAYTKDGRVTLPSSQIQPIAADDVAAILADVATGEPRNGVVEIGGPERGPFDRIIAHFLQVRADPRTVSRGQEASYFGGRMEELSLVPIGQQKLGGRALDSWMSAQATQH